jgi:uncharacterized membrane protein
MRDPLRMVVISILSSIAVAIGLLFYRYVYPKKKVNLFPLLILLSLLPLSSLLRQGTYESGDFSSNVYKSMSFYQSLLQGNLLPRWAGDLNATYGYPLFLFIYPLPYYLVSVFHFMGFSFIASLKLLLAGSFVASAIAMYFWIKQEFGVLSAFVGAIFYVYAPYHLVDTHFRVSIGEVVAFTLLPLSLFFVSKLIMRNTTRWFVLTTAGLALLLLCNPAISLVAFVFIGAYCLFKWQQGKTRRASTLGRCLLSLAFALLLSAFYWLPVVAESKYTHEALYTKTVEFVQFPQLIFSHWRFGLLFQGPEGQLSFVIGYAQLLIIVLCITFLVRNKLSTPEKRETIFCLAAIVIVCFLMLPASGPIWDSVSILRNFQFTYRLLLFVALFTAPLAGIMARKLDRKLVVVLCAFAILQTILNWGNRRTIPQINDSYFQKTLPFSTSGAEGFQPAVPIWVNPNKPWESVVPSKPLDTLSGKAEVSELKRTSTQHQYLINVITPATFKENTWYFPGWTVFADNKVIPINYENPKYRGIITFHLNRGLYKVDVAFLNTKIRIVSSFASLISLMMLVSVVIFSRFMKKRG